MTSKLHFAIDGREANVHHRVGSNVYAFHIIEELALLIKEDPGLQATVLLAAEPVSDLPCETEDWRYQVVTPAKMWTQWAEPLHLFKNKNKYDALYTPGHYAPRFSAVPYVSSVMDLAYLYYPEQFRSSDLLQLKNWTQYSVKRAKKVVAISEFTKKEIHHHYKKKLEDIVVAYPDTSLTDKPAPKARVNAFLRKHNLQEQDYFLFIGTLQPRKNLINLVSAYEQFYAEALEEKNNANLAEKKPIPKLVIAGKVGWLAQPLLDKIKASPIQEQIILTGFVHDQIKPVLIQQAQALILVGLYEGFGIPPLEALHLKTIPVVSNNSSLPEVVGEAGLQVNPHKPDHIAQALKHVYEMTSHQRGRLIKRAREQRHKFSWKKSAKKVLTTLKQVARKK